jgi:hypothetical protein
LAAVRQRFGEVEIVNLSHNPVQPVTDKTGELAGTISGSQAAKE